MTPADTTSGSRQAARRHLVMMAGTLILVMVVINVIALYGLDRLRREADGYAAATGRLIEATGLAREAEVAFKTQVQEWKNILLRGHDPKDLAAYRQSFAAYQAVVAERLGGVRDRAAELGMATDAVDRVLAMHRDLDGRYAQAMTAFEPGAPESAWRVDRAVRGMDRPLTEAFDTLVSEVRVLADARRAELMDGMAAVNAGQRTTLIAAHAVGIGLVIVSLLLALRAMRRR